jgi:peptide/nickel transport system ATP-binding protein
MTPDPLLTVRDLSVDYVTDSGLVRAVDRVSIELAPGEILGIAGESGSGKSTFAQALMRILPPPAVISGGQAHLGGLDLLALRESELSAVRWKRMAMVFQSAMDALNPVIPVGEQIVDTLHAHESMGAAEARRRAVSLLEMVGLAETHLRAYAHQLSGGMRQRVCIAIALALAPELLILDEPTTALDVIVEREILERIRALQRERGFSVLFITHDLARMLQFSDRIAVFYAARLVEIGPADGLGLARSHPYTRGLRKAFPSLHGERSGGESIPGAPPSLRHPPPGCRFHPRCPLVMERCRNEEPKLKPISPGHSVACFAVES